MLHAVIIKTAAATALNLNYIPVNPMIFTCMCTYGKTMRKEVREVLLTILFLDANVRPIRVRVGRGENCPVTAISVNFPF